MKLFGIKVLWFSSLVMGIIFVISGVLIIVKPELLAFFFAGILLFIGICFISNALIFKNSSRDSTSSFLS